MQWIRYSLQFLKLKLCHHVFALSYINIILHTCGLLDVLRWNALTVAFFIQTNESGEYDKDELVKLMVKPGSKAIPASMNSAIEKCQKGGRRLYNL